MPSNTTTGESSLQRDSLLHASGLTKSFPGVQALAGVELTLRRGEIHALMGENGAGKSTLIKILTGVYQGDGGAIQFDGCRISPRSTREAENLGVSTVYQEVNLVPTLSVAENIMLGRQPRWMGFIRWGALREKAEAALSRLGLKLDVNRELRSYSIAIQQMVAIARALDVEAKLLILDEPTSSLDEREVTALFQVLRKLRDQGLAILLVTHFLEQVYAITDRITVLRNGRFIGEFKTAQLNRLELVGHMLGREVLRPPTSSAVVSLGPTSVSVHTKLLETKRLAKRGALLPLDFVIRCGEVVGLAGLLGSGRTEMARLLFGVDQPDSGELRVDDRSARLRSPRDAIRHGFAFCSEDRKSEGIAPQLSVQENMILALQARRGPWKRVPKREQDRITDYYIKFLNIKTPGSATPIRSLSGGNQQKVLLARWLAVEPRLLILDEPTRGIDVGAKSEVEKLVNSLRERGMSVLFISSELEEVVRLSQRVVVLRDRQKIAELTDSITEHRIMALIAKHEP